MQAEAKKRARHAIDSLSEEDIAVADMNVEREIRELAERYRDAGPRGVLTYALAQMTDGKQGGRLRTVSAYDLVRNPPDPPEFLVQDLLTASSVAILAGAPKTGKTWIGLALCLAISAGKKAFGCLEATQGKTAYVVLEDGAGELAERLLALGGGDIAEHLTHLGDESGVKDFSIIVEQKVRLDEPEYLAQLVTMFKGFDLIVIDSLRRSHSGDENDSKVAACVMDSLHALRRGTGACILVTHHLRKTSPGNAGQDPLERVRGSGDYVAGADSILVLETADRQSEWAQVTIQHRKKQQVAPICIKRSMVDGRIEWELQTDELEHIMTRQSVQRIKPRVLAVITDQPGILKTELRQAVGGHGQFVDKAALELEVEGRIEIRQNGKRKEHYCCE